MSFPKISSIVLNGQLANLARLVHPEGQPNINPLWALAKDIEGLKLNIKAFGYNLARELAATKVPSPPGEPVFHGLGSKAATQADMESLWASHWADRLGIPIIYHRKVWEYCYLLQALSESGLLELGKRGLGFGCGEEPIPSLLAACGCEVTMTDLEPLAAARRANTPPA
jgi:hypothetical protein